MTWTSVYFIKCKWTIFGVVVPVVFPRRTNEPRTSNYMQFREIGEKDCPFCLLQQPSLELSLELFPQRGSRLSPFNSPDRHLIHCRRCGDVTIPYYAPIALFTRLEDSRCLRWHLNLFESEKVTSRTVSCCQAIRLAWLNAK